LDTIGGLGAGIGVVGGWELIPVVNQQLSIVGSGVFDKRRCVYLIKYLE